jgi:tetratricopeptide (TPR) repeat protein
MMRSAKLALRSALPLALLAACVASPPAAPTPAGEAAMIDANRRADAYLRGGDLEGAARQYREAMRVARTVEDTEGIATNAINLSIVYQRMGKAEDARASLSLLLNRSQLTFSQEHMAQAALRRAVLDMDDHRAASAGEWLDRAAGYCGRGCSVSDAIQNVRGQLALDAGRPDQAAASAKSALSTSRATGDRVEQANALRLLGEIAIRTGDAASASTYLGEALAIDRELGLPRKIHLDLIALGRASASRGDRAAARSFYERARAVSEADRDSAGAAQAKALIDALGDTMQAKQPSPGQP